MKLKFTLFILCLVFSLQYNLNAASRYWIGPSSGNWSSTANWSATSGGAGGSSVPGSSDAAIFNNLGLGNCVVDIPITISSLDVGSGYTGTITHGTNAIVINTTAVFSGGTFTGGSANITVSGSFALSGTTFKSTSGILELRDNTAFTSGTFTHNSGTVKFNATPGTLTISGTSPILYNLEFVGLGRSYTITSTGSVIVSNNFNLSGTIFYNINTGTIEVRGDINITNTATGCGGDATIIINGSGTQNFNGSATVAQGSLPKLTINKTLSFLNLYNFISVSNDFNYTSGFITEGSSTLCFTRGNTASYTITGSLTLNNIAFNVNSSGAAITIASGTTLTAGGTLTIAGAGNITLNTGTIAANGDIVLTNTATGGGGSATINIGGLSNQTIDATAITVNQCRLPIITIGKILGTLSLTGNISFSNNITWTLGTIDAGTSNFYIVNSLTITGSFSVYNLIISTTGTVDLAIASGTTTTVLNDLTIAGGTSAIASINTGTIAVKRNIIITNTATTGGGTGTVLINGTAAQSITSTGIIDQGRLPFVTINKPSGTLTLPSLITIRGNWTYTAGTLDVTTNNSTVVLENNLTMSGSHTLNNVIFSGSNNFTFTTTPGTTLTISGNITMIGTGNITLNTGNINLNGNLILQNTGGGGGTSIITFTGSANQSIASALSINQNCLPSVNVNKSGGTLTFPLLITVKGDWTYTAGAVDVTTNNSTVVFACPLGSGLFSITGSHALNNVTFQGNNNSTATVSTGTTLTVNGTLSIIGSSNVFINTPVAGATAIIAKGDITNTNTSTTGGGSGLILINGTGAQALSSAVTAGQGLLPYVSIQKASGTLTLSGIITLIHDWNLISGTVDATTNSSTLLFRGNNLTITSTGMSFYNFSVSSNTITLGTSITINGDLTVSGSGILSPGSNTISLKGNWSNYGTAGFVRGTSTVNFSGSNAQSISNSGGETFYNLTTSNTSTGITLNNAVVVTNALTLTTGVIYTSSSALLTLNNNASSTSGSVLSFVDGPMKKIGNQAFVFPLGDGTVWARLGISAPSVNTDAFTGQYFAIPYGTATTMAASPTPVLLNASKIEYWDCARTTGTSNIKVTLYWESASRSGISAYTSDLVVAHLNGTTWENVGQSAITASSTGTVTSNTMSSFSPVSFGSLGGVNVLPIALAYFKASVKGNCEVKLEWETASEMNNDYFEIEHSFNGKDFLSIAEVKGWGNTFQKQYYSFNDERPFKGTSYYRLKQNDYDGAFTHSSIVAVNINFEDEGNFSIYPNPATNELIYFNESVNVTILNSINEVIMYVNDVRSFDVSPLASGVYTVLTHTGKAVRLVVNN